MDTQDDAPGNTGHIAVEVDTADAQERLESLEASLAAAKNVGEELVAVLDTLEHHPLAKLPDTLTVPLVTLGLVRAGKLEEYQGVALLIGAGMAHDVADRFLAPPKAPAYEPPAALVAEAEGQLQGATARELAAADAVWDAHRDALGGRASYGGAVLPPYGECKVLVRRAHLAMYERVRRMYEAPLRQVLGLLPVMDTQASPLIKDASLAHAARARGVVAALLRGEVDVEGDGEGPSTFGDRVGRLLWLAMEVTGHLSTPPPEKDARRVSEEVHCITTTAHVDELQVLVDELVRSGLVGEVDSAPPRPEAGARLVINLEALTEQELEGLAHRLASLRPTTPPVPDSPPSRGGDLEASIARTIATLSHEKRQQVQRLVARLVGGGPLPGADEVLGAVLAAGRVLEEDVMRTWTAEQCDAATLWARDARPGAMHLGMPPHVAALPVRPTTPLEQEVLNALLARGVMVGPAAVVGWSEADLAAAGEWARAMATWAAGQPMPLVPYHVYAAAGGALFTGVRLRSEATRLTGRQVEVLAKLRTWGRRAAEADVCAWDDGQLAAAERYHLDMAAWREGQPYPFVPAHVAALPDGEP